MARSIFFFFVENLIKIAENEKVACLKANREDSLSCSIPMTVQNIALTPKNITGTVQTGHSVTWVYRRHLNFLGIFCSGENQHGKYISS